MNHHGAVRLDEEQSNRLRQVGGSTARIGGAQPGDDDSHGERNLASAADRPYIGYIRVSRVGDREDTLKSPEFQEREIRAEAAKRGLEVRWVIPDLDQSGGREDRPGLMRAISMIEAGQAGGVIVARLDRFSRSIGQSAALAARIHKAGGRILSYAEPGMEWTTADGALRVNFAMVIAEFQRSAAVEGFSKSKASAVARGVPINPRLAPGFRRVRDDRGVTVGMELDPALAPIMSQLFKMAAAGVRVGKLGEYLESQGVPTSMGAVGWSRQAVKGVIKNPLYKGVLRNGSYVNPHAVESVVDEATWTAAQQARPSGSTKTKTGKYPLAGLIRCASCRHMMSGTRTSRQKRVYRCGVRHAGGRCPKPARIDAAVIERYVYDRVVELAGEALYLAEARLDQGQIERLEAELDDLRAAIDHLTGDTPLMMKTLGPVRWTEQVGTLRVREDDLLGRLGHMRAKAVVRLPLGTDPSRIWSHWEAAGDTVAMRVAMSALLDAVVIQPLTPEHGPVAHLLVAGTAPQDLPRRGFKSDPRLRPFVLPVSGWTPYA